MEKNTHQISITRYIIEYIFEMYVFDSKYRLFFLIKLAKLKIL